MTDSPDDGLPGKPAEIPPTASEDAAPRRSHWETIRDLMRERVRRRWLALQRLSGESANTAEIDAELARVGDDAVELWRLAERLDHALDLAFARRARPASLPAAISPKPEARSEEFRVR